MAIEKDLHTIKIGHGAYSGSNALKFTTSKAAAVKELRARGVKRDRAREIINRIAARPNGCSVAENDRGDLIEVRAMNTAASWDGYC